MEPAAILKTATALLAISAAGGLVMAVLRFKGAPHPPSWLAMLHGFLSAAALTLLIYAAFTVGVPGAVQLAIGLFLLAAVGGVALNLVYHLNSLPLPKWLVLAHGTIAVSGFLLLIAATWSVAYL